MAAAGPPVCSAKTRSHAPTHPSTVPRPAEARGQTVCRLELSARPAEAVNQAMRNLPACLRRWPCDTPPATAKPQAPGSFPPFLRLCSQDACGRHNVSHIASPTGFLLPAPPTTTWGEPHTGLQPALIMP